MKKANILILIPARYASLRFPGKSLAKIHGKSMIERIYHNCLETKGNGSLHFHVAVVTDDDRIEQEVKGFKGEVFRIDDIVDSGTDRVALAFKRYFKGQNWDLIINMQGDEPLLPGEELERLARAHLASPFPVYTLVKENPIDDHFDDSGKVKTIFCQQNGQCLYFSRNPIPFSAEKWYLHIGVYSYRPAALLQFTQIPPSYYEKLERLEQLRALENGMTVGALETTKTLLGVDTPDDIVRAEALLDGKEK